MFYVHLNDPEKMVKLVLLTRSRWSLPLAHWDRILTALRCLSQDPQTWAKLLERHLHVLTGINVGKGEWKWTRFCKGQPCLQLFAPVLRHQSVRVTSQPQKVRLQPSIWIPQQDPRCQSSFPALSSEGLHKTLCLANRFLQTLCAQQKTTKVILLATTRARLPFGSASARAAKELHCIRTDSLQ